MRVQPIGTRRNDMKRMQTFLLEFTVVIGLLTVTELAEALIIRDMCNQTSGDGQGHSCPPGDYLLVRPKYSNGVCGDWMCCPANNDGSGTYNCEKAVNPTSSAISGALKNLLGPRATVLDPGKNIGTTNPQIFQKQSAPIMRRGVEGEQGSETTSETGAGQEKASEQQGK